jgi:hypothetical protein
MKSISRQSSKAHVAIARVALKAHDRIDVLEKQIKVLKERVDRVVDWGY